MLFSRMLSLIKVCLISLSSSDCHLCGERLPTRVTTDEAMNFTVALCTNCEVVLKKNFHCCDICSLPLKEAMKDYSADQHALTQCGVCQINTPPWNKAVATFLYEYPLDRLLIALKHKRQTGLATVLAGLMARDINITYGFNEPDGLNKKPDCLLAVPLYPLREFSRGYNQANLIACELGRLMGIPVRLDLVRRIRHTPQQSKLSKKQRKKNLLKAFRANYRSHIPEYVAIIDDVMTTGSTVEAVTRELLKSGVKRVDVWCCARAE